MTDEKKMVSISDIPIRDLDMEAVDIFRREQPEMAKQLDSRTKPFLDGLKLITFSTPR